MRTRAWLALTAVGLATAALVAVWFYTTGDKACPPPVTEEIIRDLRSSELSSQLLAMLLLDALLDNPHVKGREPWWGAGGMVPDAFRGYSPRQVVLALGSCLNSDRPSVRTRAARLLYRFGTEAAPTAPALSRLVDDEDPAVGTAAVRAFSACRLPAEVSVPLFLRLLRDCDRADASAVAEGLADQFEVRTPAMHRRNRMGIEAVTSPPGRAVGLLAEALNDPCCDARRAASQCLFRLGELAAPADRAILLALDDNDADVRYSAAASAILFHPDHAKARAILESQLPRLISGLIRTNDFYSDIEPTEIVLRLGPRSIPALLDLARRQAKRRSPIARSLERSIIEAISLSGPDAKDAVGFLEKTLESPEMPLREWAAVALGRIGPPSRGAVPALCRALVDPEFQVRQAAVFAVGEIGPDASAARPLLVRLAESPLSNLREQAKGALRKIGRPSRSVR